MECTRVWKDASADHRYVRVRLEQFLTSAPTTPHTRETRVEFPALIIIHVTAHPIQSDTVL